MSLNLRLIIILTIGLILFTPLARAERPLKFTSACLELKDTEINELITLDLDNDGVIEIIIQSGQRLTVYQVASSATYREGMVQPPAFKQVTTFELPKEIWLYDFITFPGEQTMSLVGVTSESVLAIPFQKGRFSLTSQVILQTKTLFEGKPNTAPLFNPFCYGSYFIIPGKMKFVIARAKEKFQIEVIQEIPIRMDCRVKTGDNLTELVETCIRLPMLYVTDITQDKKPDLVFYQDNFLTIYKQNDEGKFIQLGQTPVDLSLSRRKHRKGIDLTYEILPLIKDMNGDGWADILVSNGGKGICGVYLNHAQEVLYYHSKQPDYLKRIKGWLINHELTDLNNDGLADLILVLMPKVGIMSGLRILVAQSINWQIRVYYASSPASRLSGRGSSSAAPAGESGKLYPDSPNYLRSISIPFTLALGSSDVKIQTPYLISFVGDFNRDGLKDMILKEGGQNILKIYLGQEKLVFESKPTVSLSLVSPADFTPRGVLYGVPKIKDFNHDGTEDILIHQEDFSGRHHFIEVFLAECPE